MTGTEWEALRRHRQRVAGDTPAIAQWRMGALFLLFTDSDLAPARRGADGETYYPERPLRGARAQRTAQNDRLAAMDAAEAGG